MIELIIYFFLIILFVLSSGHFLAKLILKRDSYAIEIHELGFLGIFFCTLLSTFLHFFLPLNQFLNLMIAIILILHFFFTYTFKKENFKISYSKLLYLFPFLIVVIMSIKYKPNEDYGFYHLPYIINLVNEKIIFGLANLQAQYAWNSTWLNFSSIFYLPLIELKGTQLSNSVLFFFIILFFFKNNFYENKNGKLSFYLILFFSFYLIIKFSRISEHGFDLPANFFLVLSFYYLTRLYETDDSALVLKNFIFLLIFSTFSISIKLSTFVAPFLVAIGFYKFLKCKISFRKITIPLFLSFIFFISWISQQFIYSSCLVPFYEITCLKFTAWFQPGLSDALNQVTGAVNKSYNEYSGNLSKEEYLDNFNWVTTWFNRNKIQFLEHLAALLIPVFLLLLINFKKLTFKKFQKVKYQKIVNIYLLIFCVAFLGLVIWFLKSPVIRFGIPYLFLFNFLILFLIFKFLFQDQNLRGITFIISICILFNISKNLLRINNTEFYGSYFPKILEINYSKKEVNDFIINFPDPEIISSQSRLCWSIPYICHIGKGDNIEIYKKNNYLMVINKNE